VPGNPWSTLGQVAMAKGGGQFDTVDAGTLGQSGRMHQPGSAVYAADLPNLGRDERGHEGAGPGLERLD
jgi:hypothetical protein